jgi:hypothetical protein
MLPPFFFENGETLSTAVAAAAVNQIGFLPVQGLYVQSIGT